MARCKGPEKPQEGKGKVSEPLRPQSERGDQSPGENEVSPTRATPYLMKGRMEKHTDPGSHNARKKHTRRPPGDSERGNRTGEAPPEGESRTSQRRSASSSQQNGRHQRVERLRCPKTDPDARGELPEQRTVLGDTSLLGGGQETRTTTEGDRQLAEEAGHGPAPPVARSHNR